MQRNKPNEIIRAFKLILKNKRLQPLLRMHYERIVKLLIREVRGEDIGLMKYFEDGLPHCGNHYFEYLHHPYSPVRSIVGKTP